MSGSILVDTGPIVAMLSEADQHHVACVEELRKLSGPLVTCWPVVTEAAWLLRTHSAGIQAILSGFDRGVYQLAPLGAGDMPNIARLLAKYKSLQLQLADAALLHLANREQIDTIFTLDRRDFSVVRMKTGKKFRVLP